MYTERNSIIYLNVIKEIVNVRCAAIESWMHLGGLHSTQEAGITSILMFFAALFCVYSDYKNSKQKARTHTPHLKVTKLKSKFYLILNISSIGL